MELVTVPLVVACALGVVAALWHARRAGARYALLAEHATDTVARHRPDGTTTYVSPNAERVLGVAASDAVGHDFADLCHPGDHDAMRAALARTVAGDEAVTVAFRARRGAGWCPVETTLQPVRDGDRVTEVISSTRDITAWVETERVLRASQKLHRMVLDHLPDAIVTVYDRDLRILALHGAALAQRRLDPGAVVGSHLGDAAPGDAEQLEPELRAALAGDERTFECEGSQSGRRYEVSLVPYRDASGTPIGVISVSRDVTERHQLERQLRHLADHDALTGLPNRRRFAEELESHGARSRRYGPEGAVLLIDLDNFKQINDTLGHAAGDRVIAHAAAVLRETMRESDVVARLGGDEFAVLLPCANDREAAETAGRIVDAMRMPLEGHVTTVSVGVAAFADHPTGEPAAVVAAADQAMYDTKALGRDGFSIFSPQRRPPSEQAA